MTLLEILAIFIAVPAIVMTISAFISLAFGKHSIIKITAAIVVAYQLFLGIDYGMRDIKTDTESVVVYKKFVPVLKSGQSPKAVIVTSQQRAWLFRISDELYDSVKEQDRLLLTRQTGSITGYQYHITLNESYL